MEGKKKMYTTQEEMRGEKERGDPGGGMTFRKDFAERRQALPPKAAGLGAEGGRAGKKRREKGRKVCMFYMLNFSSFFVHLYKHKK